MNRVVPTNGVITLQTAAVLLGAAGSVSSGPGARQDPAASITASPRLDGQPYGVAISAAGDVLVARVFAGAVTRYTLQGTRPTGSLKVGYQPVHVAIDATGSRAYVVDQGGQALYFIALSPFTVIDSLRLTNDGFNIAVAPNGRRVYVTTADGRVYVVDAGDRTIVDSMRVGAVANGLAFSPCGDRLYVSSRVAGTVTVFDTRTDATIGTIFTGGAPQRLAVSRNGRRLFAANEAAGVNVIALPAGTLLASIPLDGSGYGLGLSPDGEQLYATNPLTGSVFIIDATHLQLIGVLHVGGVPRNVSFDRDGRTAIVTDGGGRVIFIRPLRVSRLDRHRPVGPACVEVASGDDAGPPPNHRGLARSSDAATPVVPTAPAE